MSMNHLTARMDKKKTNWQKSVLQRDISQHLVSDRHKECKFWPQLESGVRKHGVRYGHSCVWEAGMVCTWFDTFQPFSRLQVCYNSKDTLCLGRTLASPLKFPPNWRWRQFRECIRWHFSGLLWFETVLLWSCTTCATDCCQIGDLIPCTMQLSIVNVGLVFCRVVLQASCARLFSKVTLGKWEKHGGAT